MNEEIKNALASENMVCLRNYGDRWGITHKGFDGDTVGEILDSDFDRLIGTWIDYNDAVNAYRARWSQSNAKNTEG